MGIVNIHILIEPDDASNRAIQAQAALQLHLIEAHKRGEHPYGSMRRECPWCQQGK